MDQTFQEDLISSVPDSFCENWNMEMESNATSEAELLNLMTLEDPQLEETEKNTKEDYMKWITLDMYRPFRKNVKRVSTACWKLVMYHWGTKVGHWHFVYVSRSGQWGHNSILGRTIRQSPYKCKVIGCLSCLREYFYSGDGRQVLQDVLTGPDLEACQCIIHQMRMEGIDPGSRAVLLNECEEGGAAVPTLEGESSGMGLDEVVHADDETGR